VEAAVDDGSLALDTDLESSGLHLDVELLTSDAVRERDVHSDLL
jgi:hypothetical protein